MKVNIFISEAKQDGDRPALLVIPAGTEAAFPEDVQDIEWRQCTTTDSVDRLIGIPRESVEILLVTDGYLVTTPNPPALRV